MALLNDAQRRRLNHPNAIWWHWRRREQDSSRSAPAVRHLVVKAKAMPSHPCGRPIHWPQDALRRAAMAIRECGSNDIFVLARAVLEAAIPSEDVLMELLSREPAAMSALPPRTDVVSTARHVG